MVEQCVAPPAAGTAGNNWLSGRCGVVDAVAAGAGRSSFCRQQQRQPVLQSQFAGRLELATSPQQRCCSVSVFSPITGSPQHPAGTSAG
jgi:hypothetical protein